MIDLMNMSEEELRELWIDNPDILDELAQELSVDEVAVVFVKHPMLQNAILKYYDPVSVYNDIYVNQVSDANPGDYEHDWDEYQKVHKEYVDALNAIKDYVLQNPDYSETEVAETIANAPVEVADWDDPYGTIRRAEIESQKLVDKILENPEEMDEIFRTTNDLQGLYKALQNELYPANIVFDDSEAYHNSIITEALKKLSKNVVLDEDLEAADELAELDLGLTDESSPLQKREKKLSELEEEERTISEAEKLIDKQNAKDGQNIGE